jgi:hypothetical protein
MVSALGRHSWALASWLWGRLARRRRVCFGRGLVHSRLPNRHILFEAVDKYCHRAQSLGAMSAGYL